MSKEFFVTAKYRMQIPARLSGVSGGLILPSGIAAHTLRRRNLSRGPTHMARRLFDPQVYLAGLNPSTCRKTCANLASYGWFSREQLLSFDSGEQKQHEWTREAQRQVVDLWSGRAPEATAEVAAAIESAIDLQVEIGCEAIILPSPLSTQPGSSYENELNWLDLGLTTASRRAPNVPVYATVAVSDTTLRGTDPTSNQLLDTIIDQVTAREPAGVYVVLEQANEEGYYCTHPHTVGAVLRLVGGLKAGGMPKIFVAYAGVLGLLALTVGADAWSTGWYRSERRLRLVDFEQEGGRAIPAYYSHTLAGEFHLESDLERAVRRGYLDRIEEVTAASEGLIRALRSGARVQDVPEWAPTSSNVAAATEHFLTVAARETAVLSTLASVDLHHYASRWLREADQLASDLYSVGSFNPRTAINHQRAWREAFSHYLQSL